MYFLPRNFIISLRCNKFHCISIVFTCILVHIHFPSPEYDSLYLTISLSDTLLLFYHCSFTFEVILRAHNFHTYIYTHIYSYFEFLYDETTLFLKSNLQRFIAADHFFAVSDHPNSDRCQ